MFTVCNFVHQTLWSEGKCMQSTFKFKILKCLIGEHQASSKLFLFCEITIGKHGKKIGLAPARQKLLKTFVLTEKLHETSTYSGN